MAGVKIIMLRINSSGVSPAERLFGDADGWYFGFDHNISTLHITKKNPPGNTSRGSLTSPATIAEFPSSGIESVEFA